MLPSRLAVGTAVTALVALAGCASNGSPSIELSAAGEAGRQIHRSEGCAACHGGDGQGSVGPAYVGLYNSTIEVEVERDGETVVESVVADEDFIRESITRPDAAQNAGYGLKMPSNDLSPEQVDQVVAYIIELAEQPDEAADG
ncbi:MAG: cytochrome c [Ilumatobacter sp.]|uniref:c-type cytochrome n=1 Tax=Ilumatobacter sp. TaxID=1967498 RepID=UPI0026206949|nr:cytochrome c [Ilumatobacter sp.]MDJ0769055.1 cytochrome c [Ilumatobacter sp.]